MNASTSRVVHCKREPYDVYIGRAACGLPASKWASPFKIGRDGDRETVIGMYERQLLVSELVHDLHELRGKVLGCWCAPKPCHGDVLVRLANAIDSVGDEQ